MVTTTDSQVTAPNSTGQDLYMFSKEYPRVFFYVLLAMVLPILVTNTLVLIAVCRFQWLRTGTGTIVAGLAINGLMFGLVVAPVMMTLPLLPPEQELSYWLCAVFQTIVPGFSGVSLMLLYLINLDRFVAITKPLQYNLIVTQRRVIICLMAIGIFNIGLQIPLLKLKLIDFNSHCQVLYINKLFSTVMIILVFYLPCVGLLAIYMKIKHIAVKHINFIEQQEQSIYRTKTNSELKLLKTVAFVLGSFFISWVPLMTSILVHVLIHDDGRAPEAYRYFHFSAYMLTFSNAIQNPLIYAFSSPDFKKAFKIMFPCKSRLNQ